MKFYGEQNMLVRPARKTGPFRHIKPFRFDSNGEYTTDNPHLIKMLSRRFKSDVVVEVTEEMAKEIEQDEFLTDDQIRAIAKDKGIGNWHNKKIDNLKKELGV